MASDRQIQANRKNAARSTGPRTPLGKARASLNAVRHGLSAHNAVLPHEDQAAYLELQASLEAQFHPQGPVESFLVQQMASAQWRLLRRACYWILTSSFLHTLPHNLFPGFSCTCAASPPAPFPVPRYAPIGGKVTCRSLRSSNFIAFGGIFPGRHTAPRAQKTKIKNCNMNPVPFPDSAPQRRESPAGEGPAVRSRCPGKPSPTRRMCRRKRPGRLLPHPPDRIESAA
jgi:hypothetical protein